MQIARRGAGALAAGGEPGGNGDNQRNGRDQAHPLMNFQHVRAFIEQRLLLGISLGLFRREAQIGQRRLARSAGRSIGEGLGRRGHLIVLRRLCGLIFLSGRCCFIFLRGRWCVFTGLSQRNPWNHQQTRPSQRDHSSANRFHGGFGLHLRPR